MACKERLKALPEPMGEGCLVHLSTRMCPAHRLEALDGMKAALAQNKRVLCVSTQLIEAGVDIDFATVVRDLAGLDSIAQAAGRCNRNGDRASGRVHIVKMADPLPKQLEEIRCAQQNALSCSGRLERRRRRCALPVVRPAPDGTILQSSLLCA